jgi:uncharacterized membrane protein
MVFLNPAILFGLLAASIPILIHLFNLRKLRKIEFSTLSFLKEMQKNKIRKIKLKQWLLLALRVLIILLIVMVFARPTLEGVAIGGTTSAAKTSAVFVIDDTFSMSVVETEGSYFNRTRAHINNLLNELQEGDDAAIILVSEEERREYSLSTDLRGINKQVEELQLSYATGTLHRALLKGADLLSRSNNFNKEIYVFTDLQTGRLSEETSLSDLSEIFNDKIKIYLFSFSGKEVFNAGIADFTVETKIFEKDKPVDFSVVVKNYSTRSADNTVVSVFIDGERSSQQSINLEPGESKIVELQALIKKEGYVEAFASLEDDEILHDNRRYANLFLPSEIPVILFADNMDDARFVNLALTAAETERAIKLTIRNLNQLPSYNLQNYHSVIIVGSEHISDRERLKNYLTSGGGLFLMPGKNSTLAGFENLVRSAGGVAPTTLSGDGLNSLNFATVEYQHPLFHDLFAVAGKGKIESPEVYKSFSISPGGNGVSIISLINGSSFLSEYRVGAGRLMVMGAAPILEWSNFPLKSFFVPLMNNSVLYLASKERGYTSFLAGRGMEVPFGSKMVTQLQIEKPDKSVEYINPETTSGDILYYNQTELAGNYIIRSNDQVVNMISVNIDPRESVVSYYAESEFRDYLEKINFKGNYVHIKNNEDPSKVIMQSRYGSELWKYFLLAALLTAIIEMIIARSSRKDLASLAEK